MDDTTKIQQYKKRLKNSTLFELKKSIFILCYFVVQDNEDEPRVNRPRSSSKLSKEAPSTYYKDKYRHLLGSDSGKDAAKATKSNSAYGYGKCTAAFELIVTIPTHNSSKTNTKTLLIAS